MPTWGKEGWRLQYQEGEKPGDLPKLAILFDADDKPVLKGRPALLLSALVQAKGEAVAYDDLHKAINGTKDDRRQAQMALNKKLGPGAVQTIRNTALRLAAKWQGWKPIQTPPAGERIAAAHNVGTKRIEKHISGAARTPDRKSTTAFQSWLLTHRQDLPIGTAPNGMRGRDVRVGDIAVVHTAMSENGYEAIELQRHSFPTEAFVTLMKPYNGRWLPAREAETLTGTKSAALRLSLPNSDDSVLELHYADVDYGVGHAFNEFLLRNEDVRASLAPCAFAFESKAGRIVPGGIAIQSFVTMPHGDGSRDLLLAHRVSRRGGYSAETWSASFEEQFASTESYWGGRTHPADRNLLDTAIRGFKEEFVGESFSDPIVVTLHAVFVELTTFNLQFLAAIHLPETTFEQVLSEWPSAVDRTEHTVLCAMRLNRQALHTALTQDGPAGLIDKGSFGWDSVEHHPWHTGSPVRIACALWLLEQGQLK